MVWSIFYFSIYWECHHPNWRTPSFFRGVGQSPTSHMFWAIICAQLEVGEEHRSFSCCQFGKVRWQFSDMERPRISEQYWSELITNICNGLVNVFWIVINVWFKMCIWYSWYNQVYICLYMFIYVVSSVSFLSDTMPVVTVSVQPINQERTQASIEWFTSSQKGVIPSGKHTRNYRKSPFWMGKSTINGHFQ